MLTRYVAYMAGLAVVAFIEDISLAQKNVFNADLCKRPFKTFADRSHCDAQLYWATQFTDVAASDLWCGHELKRAFDPARPPDPIAAPVCVGPAREQAADGTRHHIPAQERVEIRGWIRDPECAAPGPARDTCQILGCSEDEGEAHFALEPDIDWKPLPGAHVKPLNTFEQIAELFTPVLPAPEYRDGWFHVELNTWVPAEVCAGGGRGGKAMTKYNHGEKFCDAFSSQQPTGWTFQAGQSFCLAPFDLANPPYQEFTSPGPFHAGDYVRMIGTIWEDGNHKSPGDALVEEIDSAVGIATASCWVQTPSSTEERGWKEIHPVDFIARIQEPIVSGHRKKGNGIVFVSACAHTTSSANQNEAGAVVAPVNPKPGRHTRITVDKQPVDAWTRKDSVIAGPHVQVESDHASVEVSVQSVANRDRGLFRAAYRARWEQCTPDCANKCRGASDDCDGTCTSPPCATCPDGSAPPCVKCPADSSPCRCGGCSTDCLKYCNQHSKHFLKKHK
jgi:hypothetical protein